MYLAALIYHGKSTLVSKNFASYFLAHFPDDNIILSSYSQQLASEFGRQVKDIINMMAPPGETTFFEGDLIPIPGFDQEGIFYPVDDSDREIVKSNIRRTRELRTELGRKRYVGVSYRHGFVV